MKTSTIVWTLAALIVLIGIGAYGYTSTPSEPTTTTSSQTEIPNPGGTNLPAGDLAPVPSTPIASTSASTNATTTASTTAR